MSRLLREVVHLTLTNEMRSRLRQVSAEARVPATVLVREGIRRVIEEYELNGRIEFDGGGSGRVEE